MPPKLKKPKAKQDAEATTKDLSISVKMVVGAVRLLSVTKQTANQYEKNFMIAAAKRLQRK